MTSSDAKLPLASPMGALVEEIRSLVGREARPEALVVAVADAVAGRIAAPGLVPAEYRQSDPRRYRQHLVHADPDGAFSIATLVWLPGQSTPVHDHLAWCVVGVVEGAETELEYQLENGDGRCRLTPTESHVNAAGAVCALVPPGDIHEVRNAGDGPALSLHVYGCDVGRTTSSIRRVYPSALGPGRS